MPSEDEALVVATYQNLSNLYGLDIYDLYAYKNNNERLIFLYCNCNMQVPPDLHIFTTFTTILTNS